MPKRHRSCETTQGKVQREGTEDEIEDRSESQGGDEDAESEMEASEEGEVENEDDKALGEEDEPKQMQMNGLHDKAQSTLREEEEESESEESEDEGQTGDTEDEDIAEGEEEPKQRQTRLLLGKAQEEEEDGNESEDSEDEGQDGDTEDEDVEMGEEEPKQRQTRPLHTCGKAQGKDLGEDSDEEADQGNDMYKQHGQHWRRDEQRTAQLVVGGTEDHGGEVASGVAAWQAAVDKALPADAAWVGREVARHVTVAVLGVRPPSPAMQHDEFGPTEEDMEAGLEDTIWLTERYDRLVARLRAERDRRKALEAQLAELKQKVEDAGHADLCNNTNTQ